MTMRETKTFNALLNDTYEVCFKLEFLADEQGNEYGFLTLPYVEWLTADEPVVSEKYYELSGEVLTCIEKQYFDNKVTAIPVEDHPVHDIEILDVIHHFIPENIYQQMLKGTFKVANSADPEIYKNLPAKI